MIGAQISGDYYFYFSKGDINWVEKKRTMRKEKAFAIKDNMPGGKTLKFKLELHVIPNGSVMTCTDLKLYFKRKIAAFYVTSQDFAEYFLGLGNSGRKKFTGRFGSSNVYLCFDGDPEAESRKVIIEKCLSGAGRKRSGQKLGVGV